MSAGAIKGITIKLGADATELTDALKASDSALRKTQTQLNDVNRALKFNPDSVTLLNQKTTLLEEKIGDTKSSIDKMKEALKKMDDSGVEKTSHEYMALEREIIRSESKLKEFNEELLKTKAAASGIGQLGSKFSALGNQMTALGNKIKYVSAAAAGAIGVSLNFASDLEESMNKVEVAFGKSSKEVQEFSTTTLKSFGIAQGTALDMAATFGDMGTSMGLSRAEAAKMSTSLVGLAGDLASFKNIGIDQATTALNGIFTGETESLKGLGIVMTQTNLDAFALANGFGKTTKEMTEAEKVSLRYAYVLNATKNAQGDFARTGEGFANQLRMVQEGVKQVAASLGEVMLPIASKVLAVANKILERMSNMGKGTKILVASLLSIVAVAAPVLLTFGAIASAVGSSLTQISLLAQKIPALLSGLKAVGAFLVANPIFAVIAALVALTVIIDKNRDSIESFGEKLSGFVQNLATKISDTVTSITESVAEHMPEIIEAAVKIITGLITGLVKALPTLVANAPKIVKALAKAIIASIPALVTAGKQLVQGLWKGAGAMVSWVVEKFKGLGKKILKGIKNALGIHSPSREFALVGQYSMMGLAEGITENLGLVDKAMNMVGSAMTGSYAINSAPLQTAPSSVGGSVVFNGNYSFMNDRQIDHFMKSAERMMRRRATV